MSSMASRTPATARVLRFALVARQRPGRWVHSLLTVTVLVVLGSCRRGCDCAPAIETRRTEHLLVAPATLYVVEGKEFILRARHLDADGGVQPIANGVLVWKDRAPFPISSTGGDSAVLAAATVDQPTTDTVSVTMSNGLSARAVVTVVPDDAADARFDQIVAPAEKYPNYALVDGHAKPEVTDPTAGGGGTVQHVCRKNSWIAFVGVGLAGELVGNCPPMAATPDVTSEVTVLAPSYGVFRKDVPWSGGHDKVAVSALAPRPGPITVTYTVVMAAVGSEQESIQSEIDLAREIFAREATGLELSGSIANVASGNASVTVASRDVPLECAKVRTDLDDADIPTGVDGTKLTVVYVDDILGPPYGAGETSYPSGLLGYSCPPNANDGSIILISWGLRSATTLAHELGHALGLRDDAGHTNDLPGFGYTNLMWAGQDPNRSIPRAHITLGQAFRMNFDTQSWLHRTTDAAAPRPKPERTCGPPDGGLLCPTLAWDVVTPPVP